MFPMLYFCYRLKYMRYREGREQSILLLSQIVVAPVTVSRCEPKHPRFWLTRLQTLVFPISQRLDAAEGKLCDVSPKPRPMREAPKYDFILADLFLNCTEQTIGYSNGRPDKPASVWREMYIFKKSLRSLEIEDPRLLRNLL